ncbi:hypothetical protein [Tetragenococcus koreensis]|uniref:hypothetical protein n=1 Tax=Tetragenococcus koreensis TaxID=290335 RepID=UPI000F4F32A2|nr:hypothetical protein [Tetragenococcus koreensis]AYW44453.1 hypothetical protein C7K43_00020 [Tetragenococcus koreensis]GEN90010.1 hypothetical protein TKO01_00560 [Tetragenococcus koreensis]
MLKTTKNITVTGHSVIDDTNAVYFRADINPDGESQIRQSIQDQGLYDENKEECRKDFADFTAQVYEIEDQAVEEIDDRGLEEG